jgi:cell wall-associated NlpC family hydrolase
MTQEDLKFEHLQGIDFTGIGQRDCYELCRDFFRDNFEIELKPYARPHDWQSDEIDLIRMLHDDINFDIITDWRIKDLRPADVLAMSINEGNPNHLAINLGDGNILHHLYGRKSRIEPLHGFWRNHTSFILRHRDVPDLRPVLPDVDYMELLRARNSPPTE